MGQKSNGFLKVTGILMIIFGSIALIVGIIAVIGVALLVSILGADANQGLLTFAALLAIVSAIVQFVAGILGVANANKPEKASVCIVFGILTAALAVLGQVLNVVGGSSIGWLGLGIGVAVPILYLIGAFQNKKRAA